MFQQTWHFLLVALAGFINRQQQDMIAYLQEENRVLREKLGPAGGLIKNIRGVGYKVEE